MTFNDYLQFVEDRLADGKSTGENSTEFYLNYSKMNISRTKRWLKTGVISPELESLIKSIDSPQKWTVLSEGWCGDAAHSVPFVYKLSELNDQIEFEVLLRDENLELMDQHLTNGGRSIPKLIVKDANENVLFSWGPRPKHIQAFFSEMKEKGIPYSDYSGDVQQLYNKDKGKAIQQELLELFNLHLSSAPLS